MHIKHVKQIIAVAGLLGWACAAQAGEVVVIGHPATAALSKEQVADIFVGKDQSLTPVDHVESAPIRAEFYKKATGRDLAQVKAAWSRLVFSGKAQMPKELPDAASVKKAVASDAKAVGYIDKSAVDASVKVLAAVD